MTDRLLAAGRAACERRGYEVTAPGRPWLPPRLADPTPDATPFVTRATASRVAIEPLAPDEATPTMLVSRLRNNRGNDRFSLFVVEDEAEARRVRALLHDPPLVAAEDAQGRRTFYNGPDRVALAGGGYAAVRTDSDPADLVWREDGDGDERSVLLVDAGRIDGTETSRGDVGRGADDTVVAHLDGVDGLNCPDPAVFPYSYARDPDDKRFRVRTPTNGGRTVGIYDGVAAMRANAYQPVPMPLVPEHVFDGVSSVRDEWAVLALGDADASEDPRPEESGTLVTADGTTRP
ncbi:hypothetical protein [Salinigranum marinum]|uniref:hypothetical protein n=1 Tax=Salinigranum marinum TaxID=1515595 RepID=UPI002989C516|nr:hypothetical protein [Salinigranum marinum]